MPVIRAIDSSDRLLLTTITGAVTLHDIEEHLNVIFSVGVQPCPELIDARQSDQNVVTVRQIIGTLSLFRLGRDKFAPRAVVVSSDAHFELARIVGSLVAGWVRLGVFYDSETARRWLLHRMSPTTEAAWRASLDRGEARYLSATA